MLKCEHQLCFVILNWKNLKYQIRNNKLFTAWNLGTVCTFVQITAEKPGREIKNNYTSKKIVSFFIGSEGVEEIKRHIFFANIDWNVSSVKTLSLSDLI